MKQIELYYIAPGIIQYKIKRKKKKNKLTREIPLEYITRTWNDCEKKD